MRWPDLEPYAEFTIVDGQRRMHIYADREHTMETHDIHAPVAGTFCRDCGAALDEEGKRRCDCGRFG